MPTMNKACSWTEEDLRRAVKISKSVRQVLMRLHLREAGGNYAHIKEYIIAFDLDISHFTGQAWNKGMRGIGRYRKELSEILVKNSSYQSYKLKKRLFASGLRSPYCEECGWCRKTKDGRLPLELDHINGDRRDNRLQNLRILCPNCHSLKPTHRGRNKLLRRLR